LTRNSWRLFAHPSSDIDELIAAAGFRLRAQARTWAWRIEVYERVGLPPA
jgi:hypothetical protein